jgi:hypothetical protein
MSFAILGLVVAFASAQPAVSAESSKKDLLFVGTVTAIEFRDTGNPLRRWVVSTSVQKVLSGDFSKPTFTFAVHSPARAGLKVGQSYTIPARWTGDGYLVDESDLRKRNAR